MKHLKRIFVLLLCSLFLFVPTRTSAQEIFDITNYSVNIQINEDGSLNIHEVIDLDFMDYAHGFYRNIPIKYEMDFGNGRQMYYFPVKDIQVNSHLYQTESFDDGIQIRIGDPDQYVIGKQKYDLTYTIQMRDLQIDQDYFYFNLIGSGFDCKIEHVDFEISFPKSFDPSSLEFYGSNVDYTIQGDKIIGETTDVLYNYQALTTYLELGDHYFEFVPIPDYTIAGIIGCSIVLVIALFFYLKFSRSEKAIPTVEFTAPKGLGSAGVGYVIDGVVNDKDVLSMIIDFANRGYLKIYDDESDITLIKQRDIDNDAKSYERAFFNALFKDKDEISCNELKENHFGDYIQLAKEMINNHFNLKPNKIYNGKAFAVQILLCIISGFAAGLLSFTSYYKQVGIVDVALLPLVLVWPILSVSMIPWIILSRQKHAYSKSKQIGMIVLGLVLNVVGLAIATIFLRNNMVALVFAYGYTVIMAYMISNSGKRTTNGNILLGKILGLKDFIEQAEHERLEMLVHDNPSYFYHILPFAYVLGISDTWSKKFEKINISSPDWYMTNNTRSFSNIYWMRRFDTTMHTLNTLPSAITPPEPSKGSGGFSSGGGGFSGGGFGGGGGGSW